MSQEAIIRIEQGRAVGVTAADAEALAEMEGGTYRAVFTTPRGRSVSQNNLFHKFCDVIAENHPSDLTPKAVKHILKMECGAYDVVKLNGLYVRVPRSVAFDKMSSVEFSAFMDRAVDKAGELFGAELSAGALREMQRLTTPAPKTLARAA